MQFDTEYPTPSKLFSKRYEISHVIKQGSEGVVIKKLKQSFPSANWKTEILANTYFEQILDYQPKYSYIVRFRQRAPLIKTSKLEMPKKLYLEGPGTLEIKIKNLKNPDDVIKTGTFLPNKGNLNIDNLIRSAKAEKSKKKIRELINKANNIQSEKSDTQNLHLIDEKVFSKVANKLSPFAARICIRHSLEIKGPQELRVTLETSPTFYAFPIEHKAGETSKYKKPYIGYLSEFSERAKLEIKAETKGVANKAFDKVTDIIQKYKIPENKYTKIPYYKMIIAVSKEAGTVVDEAPTKEIEAKANIPQNVDTKKTIEKIRNILLKNGQTPYKLFNTEPYVGVRDYAEKNRTIFGWREKNENKWHEIATLIRMTQKGKSVFGFSSIIKHKTDPKDNETTTLERQVKYEYLEYIPTEKNLIKILSNKSERKVEVVGKCKKTKYRIYVQSKTGRTFCISLDNIFVNKNRQLQQLEAEYVYTVTLGSKPPKSSLLEECAKCLNYFKDMLGNLGIDCRETTIRKIDYIAEN